MIGKPLWLEIAVDLAQIVSAAATSAAVLTAPHFIQRKKLGINDVFQKMLEHP